MAWSRRFSNAGARVTAQNGPGKVASLNGASILLPIALALLVGAFLVSPGLFIIDEVIVLSGAQALLSTGGFVVENGWSEFSSPDLKLWLFVAGPHGLAPQ